MSTHDGLRWCLIQIRYSTGVRAYRERLDNPHWFTWIELEARGLLHKGHDLSAAIAQALKNARSYDFDHCPLRVMEEPLCET